MKSVHFLSIAGLALAFMACDEDPFESQRPDMPPPPAQGIQAFLQVDNDNASPGQQIHVFVTVQFGADEDGKLGSYTGALRFSVEALEWKRDVAINDGLRVTNPESAPGEVRFAGASARGFEDTVLYRGEFTVKSANYLDDLRFAPPLAQQPGFRFERRPGRWSIRTTAIDPAGETAKPAGGGGPEPAEGLLLDAMHDGPGQQVSAERRRRIRYDADGLETGLGDDEHRALTIDVAPCLVVAAGRPLGDQTAFDEALEHGRGRALVDGERCRQGQSCTAVALRGGGQDDELGIGEFGHGGLRRCAAPRPSRRFHLQRPRRARPAGRRAANGPHEFARQCMLRLPGKSSSFGASDSADLVAGPHSS